MEKCMKRLDGSIHTDFFNLHYSGITDKGQVRKANEDNFLIMENCSLFCVADGMGGHEAGVQASRSTVENVEKAMNYLIDSKDATIPYGLTADMLEKPILSSVIQFANSQVHKIAAGRTMGSTLVAAHFADNRFDSAHVGDSRLYVWRYGQLRQLTEDHSLVYELYKTGQITEDEMRVHQMRNVITRAIGTDFEVEPTLGSIEVLSGDVFLLCSDGLTTMLDQQTIARILGETTNLPDLAESLVTQANKAGGRDNITVILVSVQKIAG